MDYAREQEIINTVHAKYPDVEFPRARMVPVYYKDMDLGEDETPIQVEMKMENTNLILADYEDQTHQVHVCSDEYKLVAHELAIWEFENMMREHPEFPITNGLEIKIYGPAGNRMYASLTQPLSKGEIKQGDAVELRAGILNSIDLSKELTGYFDARRLVCLNGMTASFMNKAIHKKHRKCLNIQDHIQVIGESLGLFSEQFGIWKNWAELEMSKAEAETILEALPFGSRYEEEMLQITEKATGETLQQWMKRDRINAWDLNSVVTQFITHEVEADSASQRYQDEASRIFHGQFDMLANRRRTGN